MSDWFVVGPRLLLQADGEGIPLDLTASESAGAAGSVTVTGERDRVHLRTDLEGAASIEALRLGARLAPRLEPAAASIVLHAGDPTASDAASLQADGFVDRRTGLWDRDAAPFIRLPGDRGQTMEDVYADPFSIPWNFVGREHDVLSPALGAVEADDPRILDLGCGFGKNATYLEERGHEVWGIDLSESAIARCRQVVRHPEHFVAGSAASLPWPDDAFDLVLDVGCLHCMPDHERALAVVEAKRVLGPGGVIVSRIFRPRPADWVLRQPFLAARFGIEPGSARELFTRHFDELEVTTTDDMTYLTGRLAEGSRG